MTETGYDSSYYYGVWVSGDMWDGHGAAQGCEMSAENASVVCGVSLLLRPGYQYFLVTDHALTAYFRVYEVDPYCQWGCSLWYDAYGYTMSEAPCGRDETGEPIECNPPFTISVWVWGSVIETGIQRAFRQLGETGDEETAPQATMQCSPSTVTRGSNVTCTVSGAPASAIGQWSFTGSGATVPGPYGTTSWTGKIVAEGIVKVVITGVPSLIEDSVGVNNRSGWTTSSVSPQKVPNGTFATLPTPPTGGEGELGQSQWTYSWPNLTLSVVSGGPNAGFAYYASPLSVTQAFRYEINPDLDNAQSQFSLHQYGNCGYIARSNLLNNVTQHESGSSPVKSHYSQYVTSLQNDNPGSYVEARVAKPSDNKTQFDEDTEDEVGNKLEHISTDAGQEVGLYGPNRDQTTGQLQGSINYLPYGSCP